MGGSRQTLHRAGDRFDARTAGTAAPRWLQGVTLRALDRRLPKPASSSGIKYVINLNSQTIDQIYSTGWVAEDKPLPFGRLPDAKVIEVAKGLGDPQSAPILDIGAGTGRNALPLARLGHPTRAIEPVAKLAAEMRVVAEKEKLELEVDEADFFGPALSLPNGHYKLAIASEVLSHFRGVSQIRQFFEKLAGAVAPGGLVLVSCFLTAEGYKPDTLAREATEFAWSSVFTRAELKFIVDELPFDRMSDQSVHDFEKEHLPESSWPPTLLVHILVTRRQTPSTSLWARRRWICDGWSTDAEVAKRHDRMETASPGRYNDDRC